jgi:hypothetical protein
MKRVFAIFSVLAYVSDDLQEANEQLSHIGQRVGDSVRRALRGRESVKGPEGVTYVWVEDEWQGKPLNLYTCNLCEQLATDWKLPDVVFGVREGTSVDGVFLCDVCRDENITSEKRPPIEKTWKG